MYVCALLTESLLSLWNVRRTYIALVAKLNAILVSSTQMRQFFSSVEMSEITQLVLVKGKVR